MGLINAEMQLMQQWLEEDKGPGSNLANVSFVRGSDNIVYYCSDSPAGQYTKGIIQRAVVQETDTKPQQWN
jgi:hypothetical protein